MIFLLFFLLINLFFSKAYAFDWNNYSTFNSIAKRIAKPVYNPYNHPPHNFRPRYQGLTGYTVPIHNTLPKCETNSYYVDNNGELTCKREINSYTSVKIIDD